MKKRKLISSMAFLGGVSAMVAPLTLLTSCGCSTGNKVVPVDKMNISDGTLYGFKESMDLSQYDKIEIPFGVKTIAKGAFKNVFTVYYEQGTKNKVTELVLPTGLRNIEENAFEGCNGITKLNLSQLDDNDLNFISFTTSNSNGGNDAFKEWAPKGTIEYGKGATESYRKQFNDLLILNGLNKLWTTDEKAPTTSETHIVSINDFHGAAPGFGDDFFATNQANAGAVRLAQESQEIISKYPGSTFLNCGDYNAGESFSTCKQAETLYPVVKAMNIQYSAVGNHAWEWGKTNLENEHWDKVARTDATKGKYFVNANVLNDAQYRSKEWCVDESAQQFNTDYTLWNEQRIKWADPYKVLNMNGHDVCIIGLTTHDTLTDGNLNAIKDLTFMKDYNASVVYAKHLAQQELKDDYKKIESFILLTHCSCQPIGNDQKTVDPSGECAQLAKNSTTDFDAILAAHSHRMCAGTIKNDKTGKNIWIGQAGQSGRYYMDTKLVFDDSKDVGSRLQSISMELKTPKIDGQDWSEPVSQRKPDKAKGAAQMAKIVETTNFPIVKNTAKVYEEQKLISKAELDVSVGTITQSLPYYYTEHTERSFGTQYMQSPTLVEPATVFTQKAQIVEFNKEYSPQIQKNEIFPTAVAFNNLDSFKNGFILKEGVASRQVTKNEVFSQNAFENSTWYGCLTVDQLKQYINYFLEGATLFNYEPKIKYPIPLYLDDAHQKEIEWFDTEEVVQVPGGEKVKGTSYSCGPMQFYGLHFKVELKDTRPEQGTGEVFKVYELDQNDPDIRIFDITKDDIDKPDEWTEIADYAAAHNDYIPITCSSFTWQGGNAQNRMLRHWFEYNEKKELEAGHTEIYNKIKSRMFSLLTRDSVIKFALDLTANQIPLNNGIDTDLLNKLIVKPA